MSNQGWESFVRELGSLGRRLKLALREAWGSLGKEKLSEFCPLERTWWIWAQVCTSVVLKLLPRDLCEAGMGRVSWVPLLQLPWTCESPGDLFKMQVLIQVGLRWSPRACISASLPSDADAAGPGTWLLTVEYYTGDSRVGWGGGSGLGLRSLQFWELEWSHLHVRDAVI